MSRPPASGAAAREGRVGRASDHDHDHDSDHDHDPGAVLACLADPTRREVLDLLSAHGPLSASALADRVTISRQGLLKHLRLMERAQVVRAHPRGREVLFAVRPEAVHSAAAWLDERARAWDVQLAVLKRAAERQGLKRAAERQL